MYIYMLHMCKLNYSLFFFPPHLFPAIVSGSDCFTGQSPGTRWARGSKIQGPGMLRMLRKVGELDLVP